MYIEIFSWSGSPCKRLATLPSCFGFADVRTPNLRKNEHVKMTEMRRWLSIFACCQRCADLCAVHLPLYLCCADLCVVHLPLCLCFTLSSHFPQMPDPWLAKGPRGALPCFRVYTYTHTKHNSHFKRELHLHLVLSLFLPP